MITASLVVYNCEINKLCETIDTFLSQDVDKYLVIVDNASTKREIINVLHEKYSDCKGIAIINGLLNRGYGGGNNIGFIVAREYLRLNNLVGSYHVILNPDLVITEGCLRKMSLFLDDRKEIGLLVPKVCNMDGTVQELNKENPTVFDLFARRFLPSFLTKRDFFIKRTEYYTRKAFGYDKIVEVPFVSGCFMMFRYDIYLKLSGFDESFFLYMEDADISLRANKISKVVFYPDAVVKHHWGRDSHKSYRMMFIAIKSAVIYFWKHGLKIY